jgi:hypothetical protein
MDRKRTIFIAKSVVILSVLPVLIRAHDTGPDPGHSGVPGEATCNMSGCHVGTPLNGGGGSVTIDAGGSNYTPGVPQKITVTVKDPKQRRWGFQLTARSATNPTMQEGTFSPADALTQLTCSTVANLANTIFPGPACGTAAPLEYIEQSLAGAKITPLGAGYSWTFTWTPPSTDDGPLILYAAANAANADLAETGDHIYTTSLALASSGGGGGGPAPTGAISHFAAGDTWTTGIFVVNNGTQAANFSIAFYNDNGSPTALPFTTGSTNTLTGTVPSQGSAYFEAGDPKSPLLSGWGQITADPSIVVQALFRNNAAGTYHEAAVPSSSGSKEFLTPFDATTFAATNDQFYTGFAIANLDQSVATVSCTARDQLGNTILNAVSVPMLSPLGHWANYQFPALIGKRGTIDCVSNTNLAATALRFIGANAFSSLPIIANPATFTGGPTGALPHFAAGDTWTTGIFVINTGTRPANFSIAFYNDKGAATALPFTTGSTNTLAGTVAAQGSAYFEAGNAHAPLIAGWGQITADPSIVVQALFRNNAAGTYYEAAVPSSVGGKEFLIPFDATTFAATKTQFYTGFAVANEDQAAANITCTARTSAGAVIANAVPVPSLSPLGHWGNYQFPLLAGKRGTIDCVSDTNVAATALRFIGDAFSSLSVINK